MQRKIWLSTVITFLLLPLACSLPSRIFPTATVTIASASVTPSVSVAEPLTFTPLPTFVELPSMTPTPRNPLVLRATLCWEGPGPVYPVVSALKKDERVVLLGRGSVAGWWVVDNPIYHDPCWVMASDLQIDPGLDTSNLRIFNPPPTPTPTPTNTPTITPTT
jgi:hypothetical protein